VPPPLVIPRGGSRYVVDLDRGYDARAPGYWFAELQSQARAARALYDSSALRANTRAAPILWRKHAYGYSRLFAAA
jgi:hypothetical protein